MLEKYELIKIYSLTKNLSLLLLNDNTEILESYDSIFSNFFKYVSVAQLPSVAIKKLNEQSFDVFITDNQMPEMFGIELIKKIKDGDIIINELLRENIIDMPILMMTCENGIEAQSKFMSIFSNYSGVNLHMIDVYNKEDIYKVLVKLFFILGERKLDHIS